MFRKMMILSLYDKVKKMIDTFRARVLSDTGIYEADSCIDTQLRTFNNIGLLDKASIVVTPNAYKTSKLYSVVPNDGSGDMTVTRATSATRVNASGLIESVGNNIARLDYSNGSCPSILVEPQRTNLVLRSQEFENGYWLKLGLYVLTPNATTAPDGTLTADLFRKTGAINTLVTILRPNPVFTTTGVHTLSCYVKQNVGNIVLFRLDAGGNSCNVVFNFTTKTLTNAGVNVISSSYQELTNGWFRIILTGNVINTNWSIDVANLFSNPTNDSVYVWGAQIELGSTATSYIPTSASAVTRNADMITVIPPLSTIRITTTFEDNSTNVITTIPTTYTMPTGRVKSVLMQNVL